MWKCQCIHWREPAHGWELSHPVGATCSPWLHPRTTNWLNLLHPVVEWVVERAVAIVKTFAVVPLVVMAVASRFVLVAAAVVAPAEVTVAAIAANGGSVT